LTEFATQEKFVYVHKWSLGELVIWDNRCTMHRGSHFDDKLYRRDMRRTTVQVPQRIMASAS
jgi:alpha-ketoglutarate-dependent 2,4-dichlorophenoxyacetate dioxygenase